MLWKRGTISFKSNEQTGPNGQNQGQNQGGMIVTYCVIL